MTCGSVGNCRSPFSDQDMVTPNQNQKAPGSSPSVHEEALAQRLVEEALRNQVVLSDSPEKIFPENVWINILQHDIDFRPLRLVCRTFCDRFVPEIIQNTIEEFRSLSSAVAAILRFRLQLPEKAASSDDQRRFITKVCRTAVSVHNFSQRATSVRLSDKDMPCSLFRTVRIFNASYLRIIAVTLKERVSCYCGADFQTAVNFQARIRAQDALEKIEDIVRDAKKLYPHQFFYIDQDVARAIQFRS